MSVTTTPISRFHKPLEAVIAASALPREKFGHQPRLYALTRRAGAGFAYDDDVVCAGAYLHDVGVFIGHRPEDPVQLAAWDHVRYAMEQAPAILQGIGFPQEKVAAVCEVIRTHQPQDDPATLEGVLLRDADILEQLGAIGVLRTVAKVGRDTRFPTFTPAVDALERALTRLPAAIRLDTTRALAAPRIALLQAFVEAARSEAGDQLY